MYPILGFLLLLFLFLILLHSFRRKKIIKTITRMSCKEKCERLKTLIMPFGYTYNGCQDIFSSAQNPWQREFGYGKIYDRLAVHFHMVIDTLPVYFNYNDKTWLIEFFKGQYGITTGGEIGIYKSDKILNNVQRNFEIFEAVSDEERLPMSMKLTCNPIFPKNTGQNNSVIAGVSDLHWWLTAFKPGKYTVPSNLSMEVSLTFPDYTMLNAFTDGLSSSPLHPATIYINGLTVSFLFDGCSTCSYGMIRKKYVDFIQWQNKLFCKLFLWMTRPFTLSMDQLLYLAQYAPFFFRKMLTIRQYSCVSYKKYHQPHHHTPVSRCFPCLKNRYHVKPNRR